MQNTWSVFWGTVHTLDHFDLHDAMVFFPPLSHGWWSSSAPATSLKMLSLNVLSEVVVSTAFRERKFMKKVSLLMVQWACSWVDTASRAGTSPSEEPFDKHVSIMMIWYRAKNNISDFPRKPEKNTNKTQEKTNKTRKITDIISYHLWTPLSLVTSRKTQSKVKFWNFEIFENLALL